MFVVLALQLYIILILIFSQVLTATFNQGTAPRCVSLYFKFNFYSLFTLISIYI